MNQDVTDISSVLNSCNLVIGKLSFKTYIIGLQIVESGEPNQLALDESLVLYCIYSLNINDRHTATAILIFIQFQTYRHFSPDHIFHSISLKNSSRVGNRNEMMSYSSGSIILKFSGVSGKPLKERWPKQPK